MMSGLLPRCLLGPWAVFHSSCCSVSFGRCGRCDLLVDLEGFHLVAAARRECGLVLDIESCDRCAGCPGCGVTCSRSRACGGGGDRRALGRDPCADPVAQTALDVARTHLPDCDLYRAESLGVCTPGASGCAGDPTVVLRGSHYLGAGPPVRNHMEHRVVPYQAVPARRI